MNKKKIMLGLMLASASLGAMHVKAENSESTKKAKTESQVEFIAGEGKPVIPDPDPEEPTEPIEPEEPLPSQKGITLTHVPTINFGQNEIKAEDTTYQALYQTIKKQGEDEKLAFPHFVQVADLSGKATSWVVSVYQAASFVSEDNESTLEDSRIILQEQTVTDFNGVSGLSENDKTINIGEDNKISVLSHNSEGGSASGNIYNNVFVKDYSKEDYQDGQHKMDERYAGIVLDVPKSDGVAAKTYTANLVWSLEVGP